MNRVLNPGGNAVPGDAIGSFDVQFHLAEMGDGAFWELNDPVAEFAFLQLKLLPVPPVEIPEDRDGLRVGQPF